MSTLKKQFMFVHIPKTAGTTVALILARQFRWRKILSFYRVTSRKDQLILSSQYKNKFDLCYGHVPFIPDQSIERGIEYFTFLRNPRERMLSLYKYIKSNKSLGITKTINLDNTLKDFLKEGTYKNFDNSMVRFISGNIQKPYLEINEEDLKQALKNFDEHFNVFGIAEYFNESLVLLSHYMGWEPLYYVKENKSVYKIGIKELDDETERLILTCNKYDEVLYTHALERFLKLLAKKQDVVNTGLEELRKGNEKRKTILSLRGKASLFVSYLKIKLGK